MYKVFNEHRNLHRLTRKVIPRDELNEFVRKCKEYGTYKVI